jgi:hypothetical protein
VRSRRGSAVVDEAGTFLVAADPGDEIVVDTVPPMRAVVPQTGPVTPSSPG